MQHQDFECTVVSDGTSSAMNIAAMVGTVRTYVRSLPGWQLIGMTVSGEAVTVPVVASMLCRPADQYVSMGLSMNVGTILRQLPPGTYCVRVTAEPVSPPNFPDPSHSTKE